MRASKGRGGGPVLWFRDPPTAPCFVVLCRGTFLVLVSNNEIPLDFPGVGFE